MKTKGIQRILREFINQNTIQSQDNLSKGQENGRNDDGKGFKQPTSTPNLTGNNAGIAETPTIRENDELLQNDNEGQGNDRTNGRSAVGITSTPASNGGLPQNERTPDNNTRGDTSKSQRTAESEESEDISRRGRAESEISQTESRESRAVGEGLKEFKAIYRKQIKHNANKRKLKD